LAIVDSESTGFTALPDAQVAFGLRAFDLEGSSLRSMLAAGGSGSAAQNPV
jgi:hypothetical protein